MQSILDFGNQLITGLQGLGSWLILPMQVFSFLGTEQFFLAVLPAIYWCLDASLGLRVGVILLLSTSLNSALKMVFHGPRPYWISPQIQAHGSETSFGVPSDHAQTATGVWGMMAFGLKKRWAWWAAGILVFLIGLSRMFLGLHFPHDVLLGWIVGGLLLWLVLRCWEPVKAWVKKQSLGGQVLTAFLASLVLIVIGLIPFLWLKLSGWQAPQAWAAFAGGAVSLSGVLTSAGTLFGLLAGLAWMTRLGGFSTAGPAWKRILRYVFGLVGMLVFYIGLDMLFGLIVPDGEAFLPYLLRYIRYALVGGWVSFGAPWVFLRLKLADKNQ
jgi:membrane-associated phospholipid phosphatase